MASLLERLADEPQLAGLFLDFDGVLADSEPVHFACWQEILRGFGVHLDWPTYCQHGIGVSDRDLMARLGLLTDEYEGPATP